MEKNEHFYSTVVDIIKGDHFSSGNALEQPVERIKLLLEATAVKTKAMVLLRSQNAQKIRK
jgi:hypothetical protein